MSQKDIETFYWKGQLRYKCNRVWESGAPCEYDTHDLETLQIHVSKPHNRSGERESKVNTRVSPVLDDKGKQIVIEEIEVPDEHRNIRFREE